MSQQPYDWRPLSLGDTFAIMRSLGVPWWVAGGCAIDLFIGRDTRPHRDVDVAVLRRDQPAMQRLFTGWDVHVAHEGRLEPWRERDWLEPPRHQFWLRRAAGEPWSLEVLLEDHQGEDWIYRRDPAVAMPLARFGRRSAEGYPYVRPEVALLYKAKGADDGRNAADFNLTAPLLDASARAWLRDALERSLPGPPWITSL